MTETLTFTRASVDFIAPARLATVDITEALNEVVAGSGVREGCVLAFCKHTTATLMINEWEEGAHHDLRVRLRNLVPEDLYYRHDDLSCRTQNLQAEEPANGPAHVAAMLLGGTSQALPISDGAVVLGRWQRLFLVELDSPKVRSVHFHVFGV